VSLTIRPARPDDLEACADLYDRVVRATFTWLALGDQRSKFLKEAEEEEVYVALDEGRPVGLAAFYRPGDHLHSLYVEYDAHGRGVGSALLAHVEALADGPVSLKVQALNAAARAFYARRGLAEVEEGHDPDGSHWFRMRRP